MKSRPSKSVVRPASPEKRFGFPEKLENVYVFKEYFHADCFETNSWVDVLVFYDARNTCIFHRK